MIINLDKQKHSVCGIYKLLYDNNKVYIGQATDIYKRGLEHNSKNKQVCDKALKIHNATIEILEIVDNINDLDLYETYWITKYNAINNEKGYNLVAYGNVSNKRGTEHPNASFSNEEIENIYDLLNNHTELSYKDIAKKYNVHPATILHINSGDTYFNPNITYPIRSNNHNSIKKDQLNDYNLSVENIIAIKNDLLYSWDIPIENGIDKKYNLPLRIVRSINSGEKFANYGKYIYPIRPKNVRNYNNLTKQQVIEILDLLKNSSLSMSKIGDKYNLHRNTISNINQGKSYIIENYSYPARNK